MRKRYKLKKRSYALCKPHKMKWENRWKPGERAALEEWEKRVTRPGIRFFGNDDV